MGTGAEVLRGTDEIERENGGLKNKAENGNGIICSVKVGGVLRNIYRYTGVGLGIFLGTLS